MKRISFLLVTLLFLALACASALAEDHVHQVSCAAPGVCTICSTVLEEGEERQVIHGKAVLYTTDYMHFYFCETCYDILDSGPHTIQCTNPNVCTVCEASTAGADPALLDIVHVGELDTVYNEYYHAKHCTACNGYFDMEMHVCYCDAADADACSICGVPKSYGIDLPVQHRNQTLTHDETSHWNYCSACGQATDVAVHSSYCDTPGVCSVCGALESDGASILPVWHRSETTCYDDYTHYIYCSACGTKYGRARHLALCTMPDICYECGAPFIGEEAILHLDYQSEIQSNENEHWSVCSACGKETLKEPHYTKCTDPVGYCSLCGVPWTGKAYHSGGYYDVLNENEHFSICLICGESFTEEHYYLDGYCLYCGLDKNHTHSNAAGTWQSNKEMHWQVCDTCQANYNFQDHTASCMTPNLCKVCGKSETDGIVLSAVEHDEPNLKMNLTEHWYYCSACKEEYDQAAHYADCTEQGVCAVCGVKEEDSAQINFLRHKDTVLQHDNKEHWYFCNDCEAYINRESHYAPCTAADTCQVCGATKEDGAAIGTFHEHEEFRAASQFHWTICLDCGLEYDRFPHYALCSDPKTCAECGAGYHGNDVRHTNLDTENVQHNAETHWYQCLDCGQMTREEKHYIRCGSPEGVCTACGAPCDGPIKHVNDSIRAYLPYNEQYHLLFCSVCKQLVSEEHTNIDDYCPLCGGKGPHHHAWNVIDQKKPDCEDGYILYQCAGCGAKEKEILQGKGGHQTIQVLVGSTVIPYCTVCRQAAVDAPCQEISVDGQMIVIRDLNDCLDQNTNILMAFSVEPPQGSPAGTVLGTRTISIALPEHITAEMPANAKLYKAEAINDTMVITFNMDEDDLVFQSNASDITFSVSDGFLTFQINEFGIYYVAR